MPGNLITSGEPIVKLQTATFRFYDLTTPTLATRVSTVHPLDLALRAATLLPCVLRGWKISFDFATYPNGNVEIECLFTDGQGFLPVKPAAPAAAMTPHRNFNTLDHENLIILGPASWTTFLPEGVGYPLGQAENLQLLVNWITRGTVEPLSMMTSITLYTTLLNLHEGS